MAMSCTIYSYDCLWLMMFDYDYHAYPLLYMMGYHGEAAALISAPRRNVTTLKIIEAYLYVLDFSV